SVVMIGTEWTEKHRSPKSIDGLNTQTVHIQIEDDVDAHCERARKAGAKILQEPETQFYGDRTYRCTDLEGHIWTIGQTVQRMTSDEWDEVMGLKTQTHL
ncbi:MAG: VOC family protein, partial [Proteobacteria bacterium]|nr:VOC family protein [Pseudomonadota bacterium]